MARMIELEFDRMIYDEYSEPNIVEFIIDGQKLRIGERYVDMDSVNIRNSTTEPERTDGIVEIQEWYAIQRGLV